MKLFLVFLTVFYSALSYSAEKRCAYSNSMNTIEITDCAGKNSLSSNEKMQRYYQLILEDIRKSDDAALFASYERQHQAWLVFRKAHCDARYSSYSGGSLGSSAYSACIDSLTETYTHDIWSYFPSVLGNEKTLPEP